MARNMQAGSCPSRGFTYIGILLAVAFLGIALSAVGTVWVTAARREREQQLLFAGDAYRAAIASYYSSGPVAHQLPQNLQDLLDDPRSQRTRRHLRTLYPDPMTGSVDWVLVRDPDGGIFGVSSPASAVPMKRAGFSAEDAGFEDAECYCDWRFEFHPARRGLRVRKP